MKRPGKRSTVLVLLGLALLLALLVAPASALVFPASNDGWSTPGGGQTYADLSQFNVASILGSAPVSSTVYLKGKPLDSANLGSIDTLLERGAIDTSVSSTGTLKIVALSLESESDVTLADGRVYHLDVNLSSTAPATGWITLTQANDDGGTLNNSFNVLPKLTFTNTSDPGDVEVIDCGSGACSAFAMASSNTGWVRSGGSGGFDPAAHGVTPIASGITVQGYTTIGRSTSGAGGFYPGFTASASTGFPPSPVNEQDIANHHHAQPPQDCLSRTQSGASFSRTTGKSIAIGGPGPGPSPSPQPYFCVNTIDDTHTVADSKARPNRRP